MQRETGGVHVCVCVCVCVCMRERGGREGERDSNLWRLFSWMVVSDREYDRNLDDEGEYYDEFEDCSCRCVMALRVGVCCVFVVLA